MSTFTLAVSCLTTSNLPWLMDLTFQVPMQYCSLQHQTLLPSPVTSDGSDKPCAPQDPETHGDWNRTVSECVLWKYGSAVDCCRGRASGCSRPGYGISLLGGGRHQSHHRAIRTYIGLGKQTLGGHKQKPCAHQDPGERSSDPIRDWSRLAWECPGVSGRGVGWRRPVVGLGHWV